MWNLPRRAISTVADLTVGTAIVMLHVLLVDRERLHREASRTPATRAVDRDRGPTHDPA
jgi:hypothetical protein